MRLGGIAVALALSAAVSACQPAADRDSVAQALNTCAPPSYEAALDCLDSSLTSELKSQLGETDGAAMAHFGLGLWIRNNWGLWQGGSLAMDMQRLGFIHPDDMSGTILEGYAARMRGETYDLAGKAAEYRAYWERAERDQQLLDRACETGRKIPAGDGRLAVCQNVRGEKSMYFERQEAN